LPTSGAELGAAGGPERYILECLLLLRADYPIFAYRRPRRSMRCASRQAQPRSAHSVTAASRSTLMAPLMTSLITSLNDLP
jgi:hypothetical protein